MENLVIIPARAGSKRLKNKNKLMLCGKPLILWTIEAALASEIGDIAISTDCDEIVEIAEKAGVPVYFKRPDSLAGDEVGSVEVMVHAVSELEGMLKKRYENIILLQPTSPLRRAKHIKEAFILFEDKKVTSITSIFKLDKPGSFYGEIGADGLINDWVSKIEQNSIFSMDNHYCLNGAIYIVKRDYLLEANKVLSKSSCAGYVMKHEDSIDIDTQTDFIIANALLEKCML